MNEHSTPRIVWIDRNKIFPYSQNYSKTHPFNVPLRQEKMSHGDFGPPIEVDEEMVILRGHCEFEAYASTGRGEIPVIIHRGLSDDQKMGMRIDDLNP